MCSLTICGVRLTLFLCMPVVADEAKAVRAVKMDSEKLAGINLPAEEQFVAPEDVVEWAVPKG